MYKFLWVVTFFGAVAGAFTLVESLSADSAPKQAAAAAIAVGLAVIPYCMARAVTELSAPSLTELKRLNEKLADHTRLLAAQAKAANPAEPEAAVKDAAPVA